LKFSGLIAREARVAEPVKKMTSDPRNDVRSPCLPSRFLDTTVQQPRTSFARSWSLRLRIAMLLPASAKLRRRLTRKDMDQHFERLDERRLWAHYERVFPSRSVSPPGVSYGGEVENGFANGDGTSSLPGTFSEHRSPSIPASRAGFEAYERGRQRRVSWHDTAQRGSLMLGGARSAATGDEIGFQ
jgi:hypothetical protein